LSTDDHTNPFAPPTAVVADVGSARTTEPAPPLWNPRAAAGWSLLFGPLFGSLVHMKNWQALGEKEKAATSKAWAMASLAFIVLTALSAALPDSPRIDMAFRAAGFGLLVGWYYSSGRAQNGFILARFGYDYPRKGWAQPLLLALAAVAAFFGVIYVVVIVTDTAFAPSP